VKLDKEVKKRQGKEVWDELVKQLEREKKVRRLTSLLCKTETSSWMRVKLENERQALAVSISKFNMLGLGGLGPLPIIPIHIHPLQPT